MSKEENRPKIAILGFGREGQSILHFLLKRPEYRGSEIWVLDKDTSARERISAKEAKRVKWQLGSSYLKRLSSFNVIFRSPGIPYTLPALYRARCDGTLVSSSTKLFFEHIRNLKTGHTPTIIGVTGTKGKGTTSTLIYEMLRRGKHRAVLAGNIGKAALDVFTSASKADFVVLELSSFQLQDLPASPDISVVLDIFPDHMDIHHSLREYYGSKANIGRFQKKTDAIFYLADNPLSKNIASKSPAKKIPIVAKSPGIGKNYEMAVAVARFLKIPDKAIKHVLKTFRGLEHRLELVRTVKNITFWNDSAATNPEATAAAIQTIKAPTVLIAGGKDKNLNYRTLASMIRRTGTVRSVVLIGENRNKIEKALRGIKGISVEETKNLPDAVKRAFIHAKKIAEEEEGEAAVLFSPAAASFDMFESYSDRGQRFKKLIWLLR